MFLLFHRFTYISPPPVCLSLSLAVCLVELLGCFNLRWTKQRTTFTEQEAVVPVEDANRVLREQISKQELSAEDVERQKAERRRVKDAIVAAQEAKATERNVSTVQKVFEMRYSAPGQDICIIFFRLCSFSQCPENFFASVARVCCDHDRISRGTVYVL